MARTPLARIFTIPMSQKADIPIGSIIEVEGEPIEEDRRWIVLGVSWQQQGAWWTASVEIEPYLARAAN